jgi:AcrR family transcriptional regulator
MAMSATATRPRSRRKQARPVEIVAAALASFAERGYAGTKLEDVASAAGISKGTIYLYFPTKEDLFREVVRQAVLPNVEAAEADLASYPGPSADLLRMMAQRFLRLLDSDLTAVPKLVIAESGNFPAIAQFYADAVLRRAFRLVEGILTRGIERGEFRRIDVHATLPLFAGPFLLMALWKHSLGRHTDLQFDPRAVAEAHIETLLRGLAADKPT